METGPLEYRPGCKVNLYLEIRCRREDGYHELATLFYPLKDPTDVLTVEEAKPGQGLAFSCSDESLTGPDNLVVKAYGAFAMAAQRTLDLRVHLEKKVPMGAGLGGGSADAAAMLLAMNHVAGEQALPEAALAEVATKLGADVPFFLQQEPCWAEGIGEKLQPVDIDLSGFTMVLSCPDLKVSTAWAYGAWDALQWKKQGNWILPLTECPPSRKQSIFTSAVMFFNSFEEVVLPMEPRLGRLKELALQHGASGALMSGSGASILAIFREVGHAQNFAQEMAAWSWVGPQRVFSCHLT